MKTIKLICLMSLSIIILNSAAQAGKKSIILGKTNTKWAKSAACTGYAPKYADTIAASLLSKIAESKSFKVIERKKDMKSMQADYVLTVEVFCHTRSVELVVALVDIESASIFWSKLTEFDNVSQIRSGLGEIVRLLSAYAKTGKLPHDVENPVTKNSPLNRHTLLLFPIQASPGKFDEKKLKELTQHLKSGLIRKAGAQVGPIHDDKGCNNQACHLAVAGDEGVERAMAVQIVGVEKQCALSFALYDAYKNSIIKAASNRTGCSAEKIRAGLDKIVTQVSSK